MHHYFAYGSNLDEAQMLRRCPTSRCLGRASLPDHALGFGGFSSRWNGAVAQVRPAVGVVVAGLLYSLDDAALGALDRCEGYPLQYDRVRHEVLDERGAPVEAYVYVLAGENVVEGAPSEAYFDVIARAYVRLEFDVDVLRAALHRAPF